MGIRVPALPRPNLARTLSGLSPAVLIPLAGSLSRAVSSGVSSSRALAVALQAAGVRRLRSLQSAAPRVRATLDKLASHLPSVHLNVEEMAIVRAIIQFYLGLLLQLMAANDRPRPTPRPQDALPHLLFVPVSRSHRTRIGVLLPPDLMTFQPRCDLLALPA